MNTRTCLLFCYITSRIELMRKNFNCRRKSSQDYIWNAKWFWGLFVFVRMWTLILKYFVISNQNYNPIYCKLDIKRIYHYGFKTSRRRTSQKKNKYLSSLLKYRHNLENYKHNTFFCWEEVSKLMICWITVKHLRCEDQNYFWTSS